MFDDISKQQDNYLKYNKEDLEELQECFLKLFKITNYELKNEKYKNFNKIYNLILEKLKLKKIIYDEGVLTTEELYDYIYPDLKEISINKNEDHLKYLKYNKKDKKYIYMLPYGNVIYLTEEEYKTKILKNMPHKNITNIKKSTYEYQHHKGEIKEYSSYDDYVSGKCELFPNISAFKKKKYEEYKKNIKKYYNDENEEEKQEKIADITNNVNDKTDISENKIVKYKNNEKNSLNEEITKYKNKFLNLPQYIKNKSLTMEFLDDNFVSTILDLIEFEEESNQRGKNFKNNHFKMFISLGKIINNLYENNSQTENIFKYNFDDLSELKFNFNRLKVYYDMKNHPKNLIEKVKKTNSILENIYKYRKIKYCFDSYIEELENLEKNLNNFVKNFSEKKLNYIEKIYYLAKEGLPKIINIFNVIKRYNYTENYLNYYISNIDIDDKTKNFLHTEKNKLKKLILNEKINLLLKKIDEISKLTLNFILNEKEKKIKVFTNINKTFHIYILKNFVKSICNMMNSNKYFDEDKIGENCVNFIKLSSYLFKENVNALFSDEENLSKKEKNQIDNYNDDDKYEGIRKYIRYLNEDLVFLQTEIKNFFYVDFNNLNLRKKIIYQIKYIKNNIIKILSNINNMLETRSHLYESISFFFEKKEPHTIITKVETDYINNLLLKIKINLKEKINKVFENISKTIDEINKTTEIKKFEKEKYETEFIELITKLNEIVSDLNNKLKF